MSAEELATLKGKVEGLKKALEKKEKEAQETAENMGAVEQELKQLLKQSKSDSVKGEGIVYVTQSRKLERFRGRPVKATDPTVEEWIEDAKASSDKTAADQDVQSILKQQSQQIAAQQKQIESLVAALSSRNVSPPRGGGSGRCWACDSFGHLQKDCPNTAKNTEAATGSNPCCPG
ncbi:hypothetical protein ACROYT_G025658 [Oculina patagonica]